MSLGTFCTVYTDDGDSIMIDVAKEPSINAWVEEYIASGETKDTLLELNALDGSTYCVRASAISGWCITTPESRRRLVELELACAEEERTLRAEFGVWEG